MRRFVLFESPRQCLFTWLQGESDASGLSNRTTAQLSAGCPTSQSAYQDAGYRSGIAARWETPDVSRPRLSAASRVAGTDRPNRRLGPPEKRNWKPGQIYHAM